MYLLPHTIHLKLQYSSYGAIESIPVLFLGWSTRECLRSPVSGTEEHNTAIYIYKIAAVRTYSIYRVHLVARQYLTLLFLLVLV